MFERKHYIYVNAIFQRQNNHTENNENVKIIKEREMHYFSKLFWKNNLCIRGINC